MRTLKMVFTLDNKKSTTCSLADPRADLVKSEVEAAAKDIVEQKIFQVGQAFPASVKDIYIQNSVRENLIEA